MKLRIYRTLWGILEETDGEKVSFGLSLIKYLNVSDLDRRSHNYRSNKKKHFGLTNNQLQAGSPFLAAEDALQEIARCDKIMIMWYCGHTVF